MRRICILSLAILAAVLSSGCGDPAPSTPLAPDRPLSDASKMSPADVAASKAQDHESGRK